MSFREAYQQIGGEVQAGTYKADLEKQHSHVGSIDNLSLDRIREKYDMQCIVKTFLRSFQNLYLEAFFIESLTE